LREPVQEALHPSQHGLVRDGLHGLLLGRAGCEPHLRYEFAQQFCVLVKKERKRGEERGREEKREEERGREKERGREGKRGEERR
jgi:hypothetical protein